jgi:hypothetical protein
MLGRFLELALVSADTGEAWQQYQKLGFEPAETGDIWPHAYGVVACQGIAIGLHAAGDEPQGIVFVRPDVAALHRELVARGVEVEQARLGADVFNELTLREPGGMALRVIEARSFSPPLELPEQTRLGRFVSLSLPCADMEEAAAFWAGLDMPTQTVTDPWEGLVVAGTTLAYHSRRSLAEPGLLFRGSALPDARWLKEAGLKPGKALPALRHCEHVSARDPTELVVVVLLTS